MWPGGMDPVDSTPAAEPVGGTVVGELPTIGPRDPGMFGIAMPLGIGSELCGLTPCADPVGGTRPGGDVTIPPGCVGVGICADPVSGLPEVGAVV